MTPAETRVLELAARGKRTREIARDMGLTHESVRTQRKSVLRKWQARNMTQAVARAIRSGRVA